LLTIPASVILEHIVYNPSKTVTTTPATTITFLLSSLFPYLHQSTPIPTPTTTEATTLTLSVLESENLNAIHLRLSDLEKEVKELNNVDHSSALLLTIKFEVTKAVKEYLRTSLDDDLYKVLKKHDVDIIKEFSVPIESSSKSGKSTIDQVVELISVQDSDNAKHDDADYADMPMDQGKELGHQVVPADFFFNNDLEYFRGGSNDKKYTAFTPKSKGVRHELKGIKDMVPNIWSPIKEWVEDLQLGTTVEQEHALHTAAHKERKKSDKVKFRFVCLQHGSRLSITKPRTRDVDMSRRPAYTTLLDPQGMIYEDKLKQNIFMHADELHKFSDDTLISVRDTLAQMLHELHLGYNTTMRRRQWTTMDQQRTHIMIKAII
nr:hypothetical protein [Tanacetum cinerariifolium]GEY43055.1 hypothetical protein [Tanacetum cinerariifolium]